MNLTNKCLHAFTCITFAWLFGAAIVSAAETLEPFLEKHCLRCHGPEKEKGELRIDQLSRVFKTGIDGHHWAEIVERINAGEMPPGDEVQPTESEIAEVIAQLDSQIREGRAARMAARPPVAHYRLSRKEYQNSVYDLLGVRYDPTKPGELNEDPRWHGFERIGSQLSLAPSHVERYYRAAETVIARAFPDKPVETRKVRKTAADIRYNGGEKQQAYLDRFGIKRPLRALIFPGRTQQALSSHWFGQTGPEHSGLYRARIQVSGIRPLGGQTAHLRIGKNTGEESNEGLIELDILASEDEPEIVEFEVFLEMPTSLDFNVVATDIIDRQKGAHYRNALSQPFYMFTHSSETGVLNPTAPKMFDEDGNGIYSMVLLDWIEWEGPIVSDTELASREGLLVREDAATGEVANHVHRLAERAWRRPVSMDELSPYLRAYKAERAIGENALDAYQVALLGVLTSRNFTYLVEGDIAPRDRLTDWELASRLSYFLWSSMPDSELFEAARDDKLTGDDNGLAAQVDRMLADPKIDRFIDDFPRQWLQLHRLGMFPPDSKLYPNYDVWLEASMHQEVVHYFREVFSNNLSLDAFINSDWTVANPRLCEFYGLPEPKASDFERVSMRPENHRGGLLTMGAILGLTSDGTRHRPVHRGVWVSEAIFGKTPPPPPANVDSIEPNPPDSPKATIRQKIEAHAKNANCAACHRNIDPLGLAFDQFDAIGQWRTHERVDKGQGDDPPVNASGTLTDGREFADAAQFKELLLEDSDRFLTAFVEHLCTYGLRRVLTVDDRQDIQSIVDMAKQNQYRLKDIIRSVAVSELFQKR
ncbi:MAG: mono/diheme cytochrome c family protein [Verrucomicrobiales bacterium]|jgi:mono/diheme cytochrome c family protein